MTQANIINVEEIEEDARAIRLAEEELFREVLKRKSKKFRRLLWALVAVFGSLAILWLCFHCLPLVLRS